MSEVLLIVSYLLCARAFNTPTQTSCHRHQMNALFGEPNQNNNNNPAYYQRPRQKRITSSRPKKPRFYWHSPDNLRNELQIFWKELGIISSPADDNDNEPLYVPSEHMLNYFKRNDIRGAMYQMGGRENVVHVLGGNVKLVPGKWKEAVKLDIVKQVLPLMEEKKEAMQQQPEEQEKEGDTDDQTNHNPAIAENLTLMSMVQSSSPSSTNLTKGHTKEFWSREKVIKDLYVYLDNYRKYKHRPAVFMPKLAELKHEGYSQLFNACSRWKLLPSLSNEVDVGDSIHQVAGLVPFSEWRYVYSSI